MKSVVPGVVLLVTSLLSASGCASDAGERYVVLVSVDGLSAGYFDDPRAPMPTLRKLASRGARAEAMIASFPSVTWPSHTSLATGATPAKHGVIGNSVVDRTTGREVRYHGDREFTKEEAVRVGTLYDAVHAAGMKTAAIIWPATKGAKTLDWNIPEPPEEIEQYATPGLADELDAAGVSIHKLGEWGWSHEAAAMRDATYTRVATYLLAEHQPNLLLIHLVTPDAFEHDYGPNVEEAYWAVGNADDRIREIWEALQQPPLAGKSDLFVVSDHGFAPVEKQIRVNVLLRELGFVTVDRDGEVSSRGAWAHSSGGSAGVYFFDRENLEETLADLKPRLSEIEGVDRVFDAAELKKFGLPDPEANVQQADLMLSAKSGYSFSNQHAGDELVVEIESRRGAHGHRPDQRFMHATFVAAGAHVKRVEMGEISNLDVAPTIAAILGVDLPDADGRVLSEILK